MKSPHPNPYRPTPSARVRWVSALAGWILVLTLPPLLAHRAGWWLLVLSPVIGAYFVSWLGMLRHELWHGYVDGLNNRLFYRVTCFALCVDPETYRLSHASHHLHANTDRDMQMYPEGFLRHPGRARLQFVMELVLGNIAWEVATTARLRRRGLLTGATIAANLPGRLVLPGFLALFFAGLAPEAAGLAAANFILMCGSGSIMTRHNQWLQHLGIFATGDDDARNCLTRNLRNQTILERVVNFLNHDDSVAHTYHHTEPGTYTRLEPGLQPASNHVQITLPEYWEVLWAFYRELFGKSPNFRVLHLDGSKSRPEEYAGSGKADRPIPAVRSGIRVHTITNTGHRAMPTLIPLPMATPAIDFRPVARPPKSSG
ncbi:MAG: fatty acid desaturase [Verrucomicrobiales bacterium]|nr:fatty acid desaturase [Verrucomicrobiales bacterium]